MNPGAPAARSKRDQRRSDPDDRVERPRRQLGRGDGEPFDPQATFCRQPQPPAGDDRDSMGTGGN